jgi:hypothetical protein
VAGVVGGLLAFVAYRATAGKRADAPRTAPSQPPLPSPPGDERQNAHISTLTTSDPTISLLPPYLILREGADEPAGARKVLLARGDSYRFEIERETEPAGREQLIPNRIRIRSVYVARAGQGYIEYDPARNQCRIFNQADRRDQRNPIIVANRLLQPGEAAPLEEGTEIRIGQVRMTFHAHEPGSGLTGDWSRVGEVS